MRASSLRLVAVVALLGALFLSNAVDRSPPVAGARVRAAGPIIGVRLADGPIARTLEVGPGGMRIEHPEGSEKIIAGTYPLVLTDTHARIADWEIGRSTPFRFRGVRFPIGISTSDGKDVRNYDGWIEVEPPGDDGTWMLINRLPLERYLLGVLPGEMPTSKFDAEALRSQAVIARTYALFHILSRPESRWHVRDNTRSQMFLGSGEVDEYAREAIDATRGRVLTYEGRIFESFFHSTCGGGTRPVEAKYGGDPFPPLSAVPCDGCRHSSRYRWESRISVGTLREALLPICAEHEISLGKIEKIEPVDPALGGHCAYVRIVHSKGAFELDSETFRTRVKARGARCYSTSFIVTRSGDTFKLVGKGWGHGLGMCQFGSDGYAQRDFRHGAILEHYYPGSRIEALW